MTKTVLVTGVSSGIGRAQAQSFLENGYRVYGVDKDENPGFLNELNSNKLLLTVIMLNLPYLKKKMPKTLKEA